MADNFNYMDFIDCTPLYDDIEWDPVLADLQSDLNSNQAQDALTFPLNQSDAACVNTQEMAPIPQPTLEGRPMPEAQAVVPELANQEAGAGENHPAPEPYPIAAATENGPEHEALGFGPVPTEEHDCAVDLPIPQPNMAGDTLPGGHRLNAKTPESIPEEVNGAGENLHQINHRLRKRFGQSSDNQSDGFPFTQQMESTPQSPAKRTKSMSC